MIKLQYRGKKIGKTLDIPQLSKPLVLQKAPIVVSEADAEWLLKHNPIMFHNLGTFHPDEVIEPEPEEEQAEAEEKPVYICEKCGKDYTLKPFYEKHIAKCEGPED